jgi:hypothetical protein
MGATMGKHGCTVFLGSIMSISRPSRLPETPTPQAPIKSAVCAAALALPNCTSGSRAD